MTAAALVLAAAALLAACGDDGGRTIAPDGAPYRYVVPGGMHIRSDVQVVVGAESARFVTTVARSRDDLVTVAANRLAAPVESLPEAQRRAELDASVRDSLGTRPRIDGPARVATRSGQAWEYRVAGTTSPEGDPASLRLSYLLRGRDEVVVVCRGGGEATALMKGCDALVASLELR